KLSVLLCLNALHRVYVGTPRTCELRQLVSHYHRSIGDRVRIILRSRALFRQNAICVTTPRNNPQRVPLRRLPDTGVRDIVRANLKQLELATAIKADARRRMLALAALSPEFDLLQTVPYVGEIRAAELLAIIETPHRFSSRGRFWMYA